ncbi:MAG: nucleotidyltransferase domain-containing protein [Oscillospiraceae bacterium]|nr:nucleotidyltransferase domain-containing protein [Oscillospiraceae bacterium]
MSETKLMDVKKLILPIAVKYGVERVFLFGSMARGDADENSDYDFLISKGSLRSLIQYMLFVSELEKALHCHVDVITDTSSDETIIQTAMQEGILLYER